MYAIPFTNVVKHHLAVFRKICKLPSVVVRIAGVVFNEIDHLNHYNNPENQVARKFSLNLKNGVQQRHKDYLRDFSNLPENIQRNINLANDYSIYEYAEELHSVFWYVVLITNDHLLTKRCNDNHKISTDIAIIDRSIANVIFTSLNRIWSSPTCRIN